MIEAWRRHYNSVRPHAALGFRPPAPEVVPWPASPGLRVLDRTLQTWASPTALN